MTFGHNTAGKSGMGQIVAFRAICQWDSSRQWQLEVYVSRNA
jgi:hypothetical protein